MDDIKKKVLRYKVWKLSKQIYDDCIYEFPSIAESKIDKRLSKLKWIKSWDLNFIDDDCGFILKINTVNESVRLKMSVSIKEENVKQNRIQQYILL